MNPRIITDEKGRPCFSGRELFKSFGLSGDYTIWFDGLKKYGFIEGQHYTTVIRAAKDHKQGFPAWNDHLITASMADELCLLISTEHAHESREELLSLWYRWHFDPMALIKRLLEISEESEAAGKLINEILGQMQFTPPDSRSYADVISEQSEPLTITRIANDYGISGVKLNRILEEAGVQYRVYGTWRLHPDFTDRGYIVKESHGYNDHEGAHHEGYRLKWTPVGRMFIYEIMRGLGIKPLNGE